MQIPLLLLRNTSMRILLLFFLCLTSVVSALAVDLNAGSPKTRALVRTDTVAVSVRNLDRQQIEALKSQKDFIYDDVPPPRQSLWERFWNWLWDIIAGIFNDKVSGRTVKYGVLLILAAAAIFIAFKLIGADLAWFAKKPKSIPVPYTIGEENIHEINFGDEIERAVSQGNYRLAVRLFYLSSLKTLTDKNLIHWQPEKTNHAYLQELKDEGKKQLFSELTRQFEYVWYGEFKLSKERFADIKTSFEQFNSRLS